MIAGGLAFTIPGIYMLEPEAEFSIWALFFVVLGGVILGLIFTALIRKYFITIKKLPYPMGQAAAETLIVGDEGGKKSITLFSSLGIAALFTVLRDWFLMIPATIMNSRLVGQGVYGGIWLSPMLIAVGYIIGPLFIGVWFLGAVIGDFGIVLGGTAWGWWDAETAAAIKSSLGIGLMVGTGIGIIIKGIIPKAKEIFGPMFSKGARFRRLYQPEMGPLGHGNPGFYFSILCKMGVAASIITILGCGWPPPCPLRLWGNPGLTLWRFLALLFFWRQKLYPSWDIWKLLWPRWWQLPADWWEIL